MAREVSHFVCQSCGYESPKWAGQCPGCGEWNSLVEMVVSTKRSSTSSRRSTSSTGVKPLKLSEVKVASGAERRASTGIEEFDRVLGGGLVPGSVVLLAGEPGIGKSTLLTQLALRVGQVKRNTVRVTKPVSSKGHGDVTDKTNAETGIVAVADKRVLYVCGEESPEQIKLRVDRLTATEAGPMGKARPVASDLLLLPETDTDLIVSQIENNSEIVLIIVDSVQTLSTEDLSGMAGSVGQIRESAFRLIEVAKRLGVPMFLVGHVTKEGAIAGPKVLEHMVDVVLALEGEREHDFRILRGTKNRFGATDEVGVFTMGDSGMEEVKNPSDVFLEEKLENVPGSVVVATMTGLRPMLVELQALVVPTQLAIPRRVSTGIDQRKVQLMAAVLTKHCKLGLGASDIFVNVAGGLRVSEPAIDLGLALAIASGFSNKPLPIKSVVIGEVGLLGEIRRVSRLKQRVMEAKKFGYSRVISVEEYRSLSEVVRKVLR